jgi:multiple sugar transport system permease protein
MSDAAEQRFRRIALWPALAVLLAMVAVPAVYLLLTSLTPFTLTDLSTEWNFAHPLRNYALLGDDDRFWNSLWVQAKLSGFGVAAQLVLGTAIALLLHNSGKAAERLRGVMLVPMVLPPVVVAIMWKILYTPNISPLQWLAQDFGGNFPAVTTEPGLALGGIIVADTWEWVPFTMLIVLAALQTLPEEYVEAARIDGARRLQLLRYVILPQIAPVLVVVALFRVVDSIKAFPLIYILTEGGPGSLTEVTNYYAFLQAFNFSFLGYSSAVTVVLVALTLLICWAIARYSPNEAAYG